MVTYTPKSQLFQKITADGKPDLIHLNHDAYQLIQSQLRRYSKLGQQSAPTVSSHATNSPAPKSILKRAEVNVVDKYIGGEPPFSATPVFDSSTMIAGNLVLEKLTIKSPPIDEALNKEINALESDIECDEKTKQAHLKN